ncbi:DUF1707 and DUF4190 domain-containing protein [Kitasatospora sp. NPDC048239]|uniref:DUF1707 and DUF4190 domain-containing protein n=1 Tax=Kitasatospora sp. NPDC048239 TaxID=3364046 RepID=UPI003710B5F5
MAVQPWGEQGPGWGGRPPQVPAKPYGQPWQPAHTPQTAMRAAHADRERTIDVLKAAYAEGRLSADEYAQRFDGASAAQTYGELAMLVADLPSGPMVAPMGAPMGAQMGSPVPLVPPTFLPPPPRRTNAAATASLVLGVLTIPTMGMTGVPAVICGHIAKNQLATRNEEGDGMAVTGLVLGWLSVASWLLLLAALVFAS